MATNLLFANAGIPISAGTTYASSLTEDSSCPASNLFGGNRTDRFRLAAAASGDQRLTFTLGAASAANFLYVARADLLQYGTVDTVTLKGHSANNYAAATAVHTASSFASATLYGPDAKDYITTFSTSSAYAYWFLNYNAPSATKFPHAKAWFGTYLDLGMDPNGPMTVTRERPDGSRRRALYTFTLEYSGLPYAKTVQLYSTFARKRRHNPLVAFTTSYHDALLGHRLLFCRMLEMAMPPRATDYCDVSLTLEEVA